MSPIFRINSNDLPWVDYAESADDNGKAQIRVKGVTYRNNEVPPVQYVEYAAGYADPVHSHDTGEFFIVTEGSLWLDDVESGPGSVVSSPATPTTPCAPATKECSTTASSSRRRGRKPRSVGRSDALNAGLRVPRRLGHAGIHEDSRVGCNRAGQVVHRREAVVLRGVCPAPEIAGPEISEIRRPGTHPDGDPGDAHVRRGEEETFVSGVTGFHDAHMIDAGSPVVHSRFDRLGRRLGRRQATGLDVGSRREVREPERHGRDQDTHYKDSTDPTVAIARAADQQTTIRRNSLQGAAGIRGFGEGRCRGECLTRVR